MPQQQSKIGAILALIGCAIALLAFFALPLFSVLFIQVTAVQLATGFNGLINSSNSGSSASNLGLMWLGAVLPVVVGILGVVVLAGRPSTGPMYPPGYNPAYPPTGYGPPSFPVAPRSSGKGAATTIIVLSVINILLVIIFYIGATNNFSSSSSPSSSSSGITMATYLTTGFWVYILAVITMLVGGIVQMNSSSR